MTQLYNVSFSILIFSSFHFNWPFTTIFFIETFCIRKKCILYTSKFTLRKRKGFLIFKTIKLKNKTNNYFLPCCDLKTIFHRNVFTSQRKVNAYNFAWVQFPWYQYRLPQTFKFLEKILHTDHLFCVSPPRVIRFGWRTGKDVGIQGNIVLRCNKRT